jgi:methionyl-tRNA formyltransferase
MNISILCTDKNHPVYARLEGWRAEQGPKHHVFLANKKADLPGGDLLFLISVNEIIDQEILGKYRHSLVIHASDLPKGRGWSPHIWQILAGENCIVVSLLEAADKVDSGAIWAKKSFELSGHELYQEINDKLFSVELELMSYAVDNIDNIRPIEQDTIEPTYYPKRQPKDSELDPHKTIAEQFDLLRVVDRKRFPAFFRFRGCEYVINIEKREGLNEV